MSKPAMTIKFSSELDYQQDAIRSITDIFRGQEKNTSNFTVYSPEYTAKYSTDKFKQATAGFEDIGYRNLLKLNDGNLIENVQEIQLRNGLKPSDRSSVAKKKLDFTIEMETGTGKTYVYLRTIMDLYEKYGFSKHIIVVPSVAIREGVFKSLQMTQTHFKELYDNVDYNYFIYNSSNLSSVRDFAVEEKLQIMVINIQAFSKSFKNPQDAKKKDNIIHRYNDKLGYKPLDLIKNTNPFVFVDEPQTTLSTTLQKKSVQNLNPLAVIRYSATHREKVNLMYKLNAVTAYEKKLVKMIECGSVQTEGVNNQTYIRFVSVKTGKGAPQAQIELDVLKNGKVKRVKKTVRANTDLEELSGRTEYKGFIIQDIHAEKGNEYINFTGQSGFIRLGASIGSVDEMQIKRALIMKTIESHLDKELMLHEKGIKVLSLFFIDSVSKYRLYDEEGNSSNGIYAQIFEEEYVKTITKNPKYRTLFDDLDIHRTAVSKIHNGYFSVDKKAKSSNKKDKFEYFKDTTGKTNADEDTYNLIMRDKEKLLSFSSDLRFIFSHSALKEGWDNPNVFQICALKEESTGSSEIKRRQEIGRGLRICVNQDGERVYGHDTNVLTVMATESYHDFADNLQKEIEQETGIKFGVVEPHTFGSVVISIDGDEREFLGERESEKLFIDLVQKGYIDSRGKVQDKLRTALKEGNVSLPEEYAEEEHVAAQILEKLRTSAGKLEIKNQDDRKKVKVRKQVLQSPEFKKLWEKVKYKTTFSVNFDSEKLIAACISALDNRLIVRRGRLIFSKAKISITESQVAAEDAQVYLSNIDEEITVLPDIVSYLQNETQLTRRSIVRILTGTVKLPFFKVNPQKFIEGCIEIINEQMRLHITDGIKYHKIGDAEYYSQQLFENEELFGYLKSNLKESTKSPYEYVVYDSGVESKLVADFESSDNVKLYTKLPAWFKINTPLGTYNPDWAVLWENNGEENLYFVVESKGSTNPFDLRPKEKAKIACGKAHFAAIGSKMITAAGIEDVRDEAMG